MPSYLLTILGPLRGVHRKYRINAPCAHEAEMLLVHGWRPREWLDVARENDHPHSMISRARGVRKTKQPTTGDSDA